MLLDIILARWQRPVASSEALDLLHWVMHLGVFVDCCLFACCPGRRWGDAWQVVAQWWLLGASSVALDLLHWAMPHSLLQRIRMAIEMACNGGTFVHHCQFHHQP
jgi:hypothetical protein